MTSVYKNLDGNEGPTGATGATGPGVPVGGVAGDYLKKSSGTNYDTEWASLEADVEQIMSASSQPISSTSSITANAGTAKEMDLDVHLLDILGTSLETGGDLSINGGDNTKYNISAGSGIIVDHAGDTFTPLTWLGFTAVTPGGSGVRYVYIEDDGAGNAQVFETTSAPTPEARRDRIFLGRFVVGAASVIQTTVTYPVIDQAVTNQLYDIASSVGIIRAGLVASANGANLSIDISAGTLTIPGINYVNDENNPHVLPLSSYTAATFQHLTQTASTGTNVTVISPGNYDSAGTITAIPGSNNQATNMRIYIFPSGNVRIAYGQTIYSNLANAIAAVTTESFTTNASIPGNGTLIGILSVTKGATSLADTTTARFTQASKFGETFGSSAMTAPSTSSDPSLGWKIVENWISTTAVGNNGWTITANSGSVGMNSTTGSGTIMGIFRLDTLTSNISAPTLSLGNGGSVALNGAIHTMTWYATIQTLSTVTEEYILRMGYSSATSSTAPANAVIFEYDRLNSVNWRLRGWANSVAGTVTTSSTAVAAGAWTKFQITINSAASLATFYVNGVSIGTIASGIPSGTSQTVSPCFQMIKSAGNTSRNTYFDWCVIEAVY